MEWVRRLARVAVVAALLAVAAGSAPAAAAPEIDNFAMAQAWARTDRPVADGRVSRAWVWGPTPISPLLQEPYAEARAGGTPGRRWVQYFDKGRLEVADGDADGTPGQVTAGLLATELITGRVRVGSRETIDARPAAIPIVGDTDDRGAPTYASFTRLLDYEPIPVGWSVIQVVDRAGRVTADPALAAHGVTAAVLVPETQHTVASVFWDYLNATGPVWAGWEVRDERLFPNPFAVTGYPISEPYWARVRIDGQPRSVLLQAFERRVLTYNPANPDGWRVESANVGRDYYAWRYLHRGEPAVRVTGVSYRRDATGKWVVIGSVRNLALGAYGEVSVTVNLYGDDGEIVASRTAPLDLAPLGPGETLPFRVWLDTGEPFARAEVLADGQPGERRARPSLVVEREVAAGLDSDRFTVRAQVRNAGNTPVRYTAYVLALYDRYGRVVGYTWGLADPASLAPGATATLTATLHNPPPTATYHRLYVTGQ